MKRKTYSKTKQIDAERQTVRELFDGTNFFITPFFQRSYIWQEKNWKRLLEDMEEISTRKEKKEHFMGFILLKDNSSTFDDRAPSIIDGQQRLTTFLLFARAYCKIHSIESKEMCVYYNDEEPALYHNHNDRDIFEHILAGKPLDKDIRDEHEGSAILKCYDYYFEKQKKRIADIKFDDVLDKLFFVCMSLKPEDDEQTIFDTMNSLTVPLSNADLLKNELFSKEDYFDNKPEDVYNETWRKTFEDGRETKRYWDEIITAGRNKQTNLEMLLRSYLQIYESYKKVQYPPEKDEYKKHEELFARYKYVLEEYVKGDREKFINEMMKYAKKYRDHIDHEFIYKPMNIKSSSERLNAVIFGLQVTTVIPYMLYILQNVASADEIDKIFSLLESYLVLRFLANLPHKNYNNYFIRHINQKRKSYEVLKEFIYGEGINRRSEIPTDEELEQGFKTKKYTSRQARIILHFIEHHASKKNASNPPLQLKEATLEHVMPKKWKKHWSDTLPEEDDNAEDTRNKIVLRFGNLILITEPLNKSLKNAGWKEKKEGVILKTKKHRITKERGEEEEREGGLNQCCRALETFYKYLEEDEWVEETIERRDKELLGHAKKLWKI